MSKRKPDVWPGMSHTQFIALGEYVRWLADKLGLRDWTLVLSKTPDEDPTNIASVTPVEGQFRAVIQLSDTFADREPEDITNTLVHELIHCHHRDMNDLIRLGLPNYLGQTVFGIFGEGFRQAEERSVDALAGAFTDLLHNSEMLAAIKPAKLRVA